MQYERFYTTFIWYETRFKENALYHTSLEYDKLDNSDLGFLKAEEIILYYGLHKGKGIENSLLHIRLEEIIGHLNL